MIWLLIFLFSSYLILIISLAIGFIKVDEYKLVEIIPKTKFSVIIPFRNESENLPSLLQSIAVLKYPKDLVEFIFVDDASSDASVEIINNFLNINSNKKQEIGFNIKQNKIKKNLSKVRMTISIVKNQRMSKSPKKNAISTAIATAKNNWILTTDADCLLPEKWLLTLDNFIQQNNPKMVVAPVNYMVKNNFLEQFQLLDFMSLQGATVGAFGIGFPFLCNGANLAYKKALFIELKGFKGNDTIASGDDIFIFEKFLAADKKGVQFLKSKNAMVTTFPVKTKTGLIQQRQRWASKTSKLKALKVKLIGLLVFLVNVSIVFSVFFLDSILVILLPLFLKILIDLLLFVPIMRFYNPKKTFLKWYVYSSILYPFFSVSIVFKSLFGKYSWKGRVFKTLVF
jgi:biofilm PGA synthesis N-glycosyltransferase PgaC